MAGTWHEDQASISDEAETRVKYAALDSFSKYRRVTHYNTTHRRRQNLYALPQALWQLLASPPFQIQEKLNRVDNVIDANAKIADHIVSHSIAAFGVEGEAWKDKATSNDHDKARSTIRQLYRDWSAEGNVERRACYGPVLADLAKLFPNKMARDNVKVLVPGAGLGRLLVELVVMGFEAEGNELSFHQLMASNWLLNGLQSDERYELYPWALSFSNQISVDNQLQKVSVPDVHPGTYLHEASKDQPRHAFERMGMSAGDFCLLYTTPKYRATFNVVSSVYFIDTAPNLIRYLDAIKNVLVDGGYWINLGPLLWHFESRGPKNDEAAKAEPRDQIERQNAIEEHDSSSKGIADPGSFELTVDEVLLLIAHMGFEVLEYDVQRETQGYIQDPNSMMTTGYKVLHFVAKLKDR